MFLFAILICGQLGIDILVNDDTIGGCVQQFPAVAVDELGYFYCVWTDYRTSDYDGDVYLQKFDPAGHKIGRNVNLIEDLPDRDIWNYQDWWSDIAVARDRVVVVVADRRRGNFDIYLEGFDREINRVTPLLMLNDDVQGANQTLPGVAVAGRNYVAVWEDWREENRTVYGQMLDSTFWPMGGNFRISEIQGVAQYHPAVAGYRGGVVVLWTQNDSGTSYIWGRRFGADGIPLGSSFLVLAHSAENPFCTMDTNGYFWAGGEESGTDLKNVTIRRYDPQGQPVTTPIVINDSFPVRGIRYPAASTARDGSRTLIVWCDERAQPGQIWGQLVDEQGNRVGPNRPISSAQWLTTPCCAYLNDTSYLTVWEDSRAANQDIYYYHPFRGEARVNDDEASAIQDFPCVGIDQTGRAFVAWFDYRNGQDDADIYAQRYDSQGHVFGANFRVNDDGPYNQQHFLWVATARTGNTVVVWRDTRRGGYAVYGQRYDQDGNPLGANLAVSESAAAEIWPSFIPQAAINDAGDFLVCWAMNDSVRCQFYRWNGEPVGGNRCLARSDQWPTVHLASDKSYWCAWPLGSQLLLQRFDSLGQPLTPGTEICRGDFPRINTMTVDRNGVVWVVWTDAVCRIWCIRASPDGLPIGNPFRLDDAGINCDHGFPCVAGAGDIIIALFTDFRIPGDPNVMGQAFRDDGSPLGPNFIVNHDPQAYVHQWTWESVAACSDYVAYCWIDNRNPRCWDVYYQLNQVSAITERPPVESAGEGLVSPTIVRSSGSWHLRFSNVPMPTRVVLYDESGIRRQVLFSGAAQGQLTFPGQGLAPGVYFIKIERGGLTGTRKIVLTQ